MFNRRSFMGLLGHLPLVGGLFVSGTVAAETNKRVLRVLHKNGGYQSMILVKRNNKVFHVPHGMCVSIKPRMTITRHYHKGKLHRLDGPALEVDNGSKEWRVHGKLHRENGPAIEMWNGDQAWYREGVLHREDGPASVSGVGSHLQWWVNGQRHRLDGPAMIVQSANGELLREEWWIDGLLHRDDGPASVTRDCLYYYVHGVLQRTAHP